MAHVVSITESLQKKVGDTAKSVRVGRGEFRIPENEQRHVDGRKKRDRGGEPQVKPPGLSEGRLKRRGIAESHETAQQLSSGRSKR